jgi:hypothetical protein
MGSGALIYITNFRKDWFRHSNVDRGDTHTDSIRLLLFFQNKWLRHYAASRKIAGSNPDEVDFFLN